MTTERVSRASLERLRDRLSERDQAILSAVAAHRFLTTKHVERLLFTEHATPLSAARATSRALKRLHALRVLHRLERRVGGIHAGSAGFIWSIGPAGDGLLRLDSGRRVRKRQDEPSRTFLTHTLAVADAHLSLVDAARRGHFELLEAQLEPHSWRRVAGMGSAEALRPDLYAVTAAVDYEDHWFIEVDLGTESVPALLRKCALYQAYRQTGSEQLRSGAFPLVVWLLDRASRCERLAEAIKQAPAPDSAMFRLALHEQLPELVQSADNYLI